MRHRQRAQITPFLLLAALILTGGAALVIDAGVVFVTQRQIQNATDAAALAAVWYEDVCPTPSGPNPWPQSPPQPQGSGCDTSTPPNCAAGRHHADCAADNVANANLGYTGRLCSSVTLLPDNKRRGTPKAGLNFYIMEIDCDAPYWFARIFPSIPATIHISTKATATVGYRTQTNDASGVVVIPTPAPPHSVLVARLVL